MSGVRIRPAGPSDAEAIAGVQARSWRAAYLGMLPNEVLLGFGHAQGVTFWHRILERVDGDDSVLVAEFDGDVVGFVSCGPIRDRIPGYSGEFYALYVLPEAQGCGIGTSLLAHAGGNETLTVDGGGLTTVAIVAARRIAAACEGRMTVDAGVGGTGIYITLPSFS